MAQGEEILIADASDRDREGLRKLFDEEGYVCTACRDEASARDLVQRKFFPLAVVDLDFGGTSGGLELARFVRQHSKPTQIVLLTARRSFEAAVDALRLGVVDVVTKRPDQIEQLTASVARALDKYHAREGGGLVGELQGLMEEALKIMFELARTVYGRGESSGRGLAVKPTILIVDEDQEFLRELASRVRDKDWEVSVELSGGSGLDKASSFSFQILAVRNQLVDLPGAMVVRSAQAQHPETVALVYSTAGGGNIERYEKGQRVGSAAGASPDDLARAIGEVVGKLGTLREERRYLQAFRAQHGAFLKRFAELKTRLQTLA